MTAVASAALTKAHALELLKRLHRDDSTGPGSSACRLYFLDVDVLSNYINGGNGDVRSEWSSLLSLLPGDRPAAGAVVDEYAHRFADAIARSVSGFLMGGFREGRSMQSGQFWVTPEHARELDSLINSVLLTGHEALGQWHRNLGEQYQALAAGGVSDTQATAARLASIFELLRQFSSAGKVARAYGARRQWTASFEHAPVFPPESMGRAFVIRTAAPAFQRKVEDIAHKVLEALLERAKGAQRNLSYWPAIEYLYLSVFELYSTTLRIADCVKRFRVDTHLRSLIPSSPSDPDDWIRQSARTTFVQISDVYALARLIALGDWLNEHHSLPAPLAWRVSLLSGSIKLEHLLRRLNDQSIGLHVEIVHPLSVMRFDEFLSPHRLVRGSEEDSNDAAVKITGAEYALEMLGDPDQAAKDLDATKFYDSLFALLSSASSGYALQQDRSLVNLHRRLRENKEEYGRIVQSVGHAIASRFIQTYVQVNRLDVPRSGVLPTVSLPWVSLPLPGVVVSPAEKFVIGLHKSTNAAASSDDYFGWKEVDQLVKSDSTGYTAGLCAALGYLAMGKQYLQSAEMAANTALRMALASNEPTPGGDYVPEGNEALYLSAFVSRMRVSPKLADRVAALEWRDTHRRVMEVARERCDRWVLDWPAIASVDASGSGKTRAELAALRYDVEDAARDVFCMLIDLLVARPDGADTSKKMWVREAKTFVSELAAVLERLSSPPDEVHTSAELAFVRAQLTVVLIQFWIVVRAKPMKDDDSASARSLEALIIKAQTLVPSNDSQLLIWLSALFAKHGGSEHRSGQAPMPRLRVSPFASMDEFRFPFFERVLDLRTGASFADALPGRAMDVAGSAS